MMFSLPSAVVGSSARLTMEIHQMKLCQKGAVDRYLTMHRLFHEKEMNSLFQYLIISPT